MISFPAVAVEQLYNPYEDKWETVKSDSDVELKYNWSNDTYSYQNKENKVEYNPYEDEWEFPTD